MRKVSSNRGLVLSLPASLQTGVSNGETILIDFHIISMVLGTAIVAAGEIGAVSGHIGVRGSLGSIDLGAQKAGEESFLHLSQAGVREALCQRRGCWSARSSQKGKPTNQRGKSDY